MKRVRLSTIPSFTLAIMLMGACSTTKVSQDTSPPDMGQEIILPPTIVKPRVYQASRERTTDIIHTKLDLRFNWEKQWVLGKATITARPYFYPSDSLELDARGFDIHSVSLATKTGPKALKYHYAPPKLIVYLDTTYSKNDTCTITIGYTAKPNELPVGGSDAITQDKGLYFINPMGKDQNTPRQIWTQGETQANSNWFPTVDAPNERMTQEILLTVDTGFVTLSNGLLLSQKNNGDGTRTDHWKQSLGHTPYLAMIAVGQFIKVTDQWQGKDVDYYLEETYAPYARDIFGNTPEMLTFFSEKLGMTYPWEKYAQIVVRDFVSGAMENTTAVIHGEFVQGTRRDLLDGHHEDVIAHELFHHWFGDLVTCESWANLPLNESFATYGEYLWNEYKYGRDEADHFLNMDLENYMAEADFKQVALIRYYHNNREDMFDGHSYQKGGRVLHMLRKLVGDEAFFTALTIYLEKHQFQAVEIHDLRLTFEKVTGQDLNWFFNQWFFSPGHPDLEITYHYDDSAQTQLVFIEQKQHPDTAPIFQFPVRIDLYAGGEVASHEVMVKKGLEKISLPSAVKPDLVNFDADKSLLCKKSENKIPPDWAFQYAHAPLYMDRAEALDGLMGYKIDLAKTTFLQALEDPHWALRSQALEGLKEILNGEDAGAVEAIKRKVQDKKALVRAAALDAMSAVYGNDYNLGSLYVASLKDSSYAVLSAALAAICQTDSASCLTYATQFEKEDNEFLLIDIAFIYADFGGEAQHAFFKNIAHKVSGYARYSYYAAYGRYLQRQDWELVREGLTTLEDGGRRSASWQIRFAAIDAMIKLMKHLDMKVAKLEMELGDAMRMADDSPSATFIQKELDTIRERRDGLIDTLSAMKNDESHRILLSYMSREIGIVQQRTSE